MSPKWSRPGSGGTTSIGEISSPISPDRKDDISVLKQELRRSTQRIAELEAKLNVSHWLSASTKSIFTDAKSVQSAKALENNIQEKRQTVASLETERETVLRELLVIKESIDLAKDNG